MAWRMGTGEEHGGGMGHVKAWHGGVFWCAWCVWCVWSGEEELVRRSW